jgi:hypothetical protein
MLVLIGVARQEPMSVHGHADALHILDAETAERHRVR